MYDTFWCRGSVVLALGALVGCGGATSAPQATQPSAKTTAKTIAAKTTDGASTLQPPAAKTPDIAPKKTEAPQKTGVAAKTGERQPSTSLPLSRSGRSLADELREAQDAEDALRKQRPQLARPRKLDDDRLRAAGLRKLEGKHLTLYTDLPSKPAIDELPEVWDQAYPQWCEFFRIEKDQMPPWHMRGFLMAEKKSRVKFQDLDLIPPQVPDFPAGYSLNYEFFMYEQPSDYYRRHLMLHEGTHGVMWTMMGRCTSPWYAEGTAELLGTHLWENRKLTLRHFPRSREETPYHGRIKLVRECFAAVRARTLNEIVASASDLHGGRDDDKLRQEGYAWSWASAAFLDGHRRYRERFNLFCSRMRTVGAIPGQFRLWYEPDWEDLMEEWQVFVAGLEYGYDIPRNEIAFARGAPLPAGGKSVAVRADRGWQSAQVTLEAGKAYELTASGRVVLAQEPRPWESEADGVTIRYHQGLPLGTLVAALRMEKEDRGQTAVAVSAFLRPAVVGRSLKITPSYSGTLYLKINDSPAELADNTGELRVRVTRAE